MQQGSTYPHVTLHLGLFFDGTGNNRDNAQAEGAGISYSNTPSNIAHLHGCYPDHRQTPTTGEHVYLRVYVEGIGTRSGKADNPLGQALGIGLSGIEARVKQVPRQALAALQAWASMNPCRAVGRVEFDLFGFSRGAAAARHCANDVLTGPRSGLARVLPAGHPLLASGFRWRHGNDFCINFMGLYDTVPAIVNPLRGDFSPNDALNDGLVLHLAPGSARHIIHLVAEHEYRHNFSVALSDHDVRVPGAHADLGGGYPPLEDEQVFLHQPASCEVLQSLPVTESIAWQTARRFMEQGAEPYGLRFGQPQRLLTWEVAQPKRRLAASPPMKRVYAVAVSERQVCDGLGRVYLQLMHRLATQAGVALGPLAASLSPPAALTRIAEKLLAHAQGQAPLSLTDAEQAMLCRQYIHLSAHWNTPEGEPVSDLAVRFVHRPACSGRRAEHRTG